MQFDVFSGVRIMLLSNWMSESLEKILFLIPILNIKLYAVKYSIYQWFVYMIPFRESYKKYMEELSKSIFELHKED